MQEENHAPTTEPIEGIFRVGGVLIGHIGLMQDGSTGTNVPGLGTPPADLRGIHRVIWIIKEECRFNPLTVFELYICLNCMVWGLFLLLPWNTFDGASRLWQPLRTLFASMPGDYWYDTGAEIGVGLCLFLFHLLHFISIARGKNGEHIRTVTICFLLTGHLCLCLLFFNADVKVQSWLLVLLNCGFLVACFWKVFQNAGIRRALSKAGTP